MVPPLVGQLDKLVFVKCVEFKGIIGMSVILATPFRISPLNKPVLSTTSIIHPKMTPTPIPSIQVGDNTSTSPTKIQIPLHITPYKIILTFSVFNTVPSISASTTSTSKVQFGEYDGEVHSKSKQDK